MLFGLLTMITALSISAVAIYYSVAGLVAIFAAAAVPIVVMGGTLEIAKLVTAVWLHKYWSRAAWWLKTYLSAAVIVLMLITSMGIFGFLSKAHIEQTTAGAESAAKVQQLTKEIERQQAIVTRADEQVKKLETTGSGADAQIQAQIDKEQERIDNAYKRIQPAIDEQNRIIGSQAKLYQDELSRIDEQLATLQRYIDAGDKESIKKAQAMIGARQDGSWGSRTAAAADEWKAARRAQRTDLLTKIEQATNNPQARAAANEIKRLRQTVEREIAESNRLINRLRQNIGKTDKTVDIQKSVDEQMERIKIANAEIDRLTQEKYAIEGEFRKLEAEVGPIKYIAEFVYGDQADTNMLEKAVRWVIITIIFVFDPLAVLLLIASQYTFIWKKEDDNNKEDLNDPEPNSLLVEPSHTWPEQPSEDKLQSEDIPTDPGTESQNSGTEEDSVQQVVEEKVKAEEADTLAQWNEMIAEAEKAVDDEADLEILESVDATEKEAMQIWKAANPGDSLKRQRKLLSKGVIQELPWKEYLKAHADDFEDNDAAAEAAKWAQEQIESKKKDSDVDGASGKDSSEEISGSVTYVQNQEQSTSSIWNKVKKKADE